MKRMSTTRIVVTLADMGEGPDPDVRLRRLLKVARRVFAFRAVDVREVRRCGSNSAGECDPSASSAGGGQSAGKNL